MLLVAPIHTVANLMSKRRLFDVAWHFVKESIISVCVNISMTRTLRIPSECGIQHCAEDSHTSHRNLRMPRTENAPGAPGGALPKAAANFDARALAA